MEPGAEGEWLGADGWTARGVYSDGPRRLTGRPEASEVEIFPPRHSRGRSNPEPEIQYSEGEGKVDKGNREKENSVRPIRRNEPSPNN